LLPDAAERRVRLKPSMLNVERIAVPILEAENTRRIPRGSNDTPQPEPRLANEFRGAVSNSNDSHARASFSSD